MNQNNTSPKVTSISWGEIQIENESTTFKDVKLFPGGCREWNWNETGTHHSPGIQPADLEELRDHGASVIILSKGMNKRLKTSDEAKHFLEEFSIEYQILQTKKAVEIYNYLCDDQAVGALIRSTC